MDPLQDNGLGATTSQQISIDSHIRSRTPVVESSNIPSIGMEFYSIDDAYEFYNLYAREAGFSVRKSTQKKDDAGNITNKIFVCAKEGKTNSRHTDGGKPSKRSRSQTREECKAYISLKKSNTSSTYTVIGFLKEHTHPLTPPDQTHLLRSHRNVSDGKKLLIGTLGSANIRPSIQMNVLESMSGGFKNIGFTDRDLHNYNRDQRKKIKGLDAQMLFDYFKEKKEQNESFVFTIKKDDQTGKISHVFWADPIARINYMRFGSVVSFDTTYETNRYKMILAPFTGVNHHGRSIVLGCGLLSGETAEDFEWLFDHWQRAMPGDPPRCIITDQDLGMSKAIAKMFPDTIYRFCIWHIMEKLQKYLGVIASNKYFSYEFKGVVYNVETPEEFEIEWPKILEKWKLTENQWLADMYEMRSTWVPAYLNNNFFAGIQSTQRSETLNSALKHHVNQYNSFCEFMLGYERFVQRQRHLELVDDHETFNSRPKMMTSMVMEKKMGNIYTRNVFKKIQKELYYSAGCNVHLHSDSELESIFTVIPPPCLENEDEKEERGNNYDRERKVIYEKATQHPRCSCRHFEFVGLPCMHLLSVLRHFGFDEIPGQFILERWTRHAKHGDVIDKDGDIVGAVADSSLMARHVFLSQIFAQVADDGCLTKETFQRSVELHAFVRKEQREINLRSGAINSDNNRDSQQPVDQVQYHEPDICRTKGSGKRLKSTREKFRFRGRLCRGCNKRDVNHDSRNCPVLKNMCSRSPDHDTQVNMEMESSDNTNPTNTASSSSLKF